ncbi:MAG: hypothetical protein J7530_19810 [Novosphingobium sp.]|nr:hypothetical protein [Novosphingobium sp.]
MNKAVRLIAFWPFHGSAKSMDKVTNEAATEQAVDRIRAALARLERAVSQNQDLQARHDRLRGTVEDALGEIDALLADRKS